MYLRYRKKQNINLNLACFIFFFFLSRVSFEGCRGVSTKTRVGRERCLWHQVSPHVNKRPFTLLTHSLPSVQHTHTLTRGVKLIENETLIEPRGRWYHALGMPKMRFSRDKSSWTDVPSQQVKLLLNHLSLFLFIPTSTHTQTLSNNPSQCTKWKTF